MPPAPLATPHPAPGRRPRRGLPGRRGALVVATATVAVLLMPGTTPLHAPAAQAAGVDRVMARRMCESGASKEWGLAVKESDVSEAAALMRGRIRLKGGTFVVPANPTWKRQRGLDDSGNNQQHALHWALPLLRQGIATRNQAMIRRFYALVGDWVRDNPPGHAVTPGAWQDFQVGYRLLTLACAVAGPGGTAGWLGAALRTHIAQVSRPDGWLPLNNTGMLSTSGLLAAACITHDWRARTLAWRRFQTMAGKLYRGDGSDREGSPHYTLMNWQWQADHLARIRMCGITPPPAMLAGARMPTFIAAATRPDGNLESIGDGWIENPRVAVVGGTVAEYAATRGTSGPRPAATFSRFAAGTIFARSGWGTSRPFTSETFWSMRTGAGAPSVFHGHSDQTAITYFAGGAPLLVDSGVYRYSRNAARAYITSRRAHNAVSIHGATPKAGGVTLRASAHTRLYDLVSVEDRNYPGILITRDVYFSRTGEWLLVLDTVTSRTHVRGDQRWQLPATRGARVWAGGADSTGPGTNVALRWLDIPVRPGVEKGLRSPYSGWTSTAYGRLTAAPVVQSTRGGTAMRWATVVLPVRAGEHSPTRTTGDPAAAVVTGRVVGAGAGSVATASVTLPGKATETVVLRHGRVNYLAIR